MTALIATLDSHTELSSTPLQLTQDYGTQVRIYTTGFSLLLTLVDETEIGRLQATLAKAAVELRAYREACESAAAAKHTNLNYRA